MDVKGKVALVTGASKGIGRAAAIVLARAGARVVLTYRTDEMGATDTLEECNTLSEGNMMMSADITKEDDVASLFAEIDSVYGSLDILVNNAGIFLEEDSPTNVAAFETLIHTNLIAHVRVTSYALRRMKKGKIVNVSSIHGRLGNGRPEATGYAASKAALNSYTQNLAKAVAPDILVNAVAPGQVLTPMWGEMTDEEKNEFGTEQLIRRFITPEEIADSILFLVKNDALCGEILTIDGGMGLKKFY